MFSREYELTDQQIGGKMHVYVIRDKNSPNTEKGKSLHFFILKDRSKRLLLGAYNDITAGSSDVDKIMKQTRFVLKLFS